MLLREMMNADLFILTGKGCSISGDMLLMSLQLLSLHVTAFL